MMFPTLVLQFYERYGQNKRRWKKTEEQQNSATIMTSVGGKGTVFPVKLNCSNKH